MIKKFIETNGYSPRYQDIADAMGVKSLSGVSNAVRQLAFLGYVTLVGEGQAKKIRLLANQYHELLFCHREHVQIWFQGNFCPMCELIRTYELRIQQPPTQEEVFGK